MNGRNRIAFEGTPTLLRQQWRAMPTYLARKSTLWRITGLLHDLDYEQHPTLEEHPYVGAKLLRELNYPEVNHSSDPRSCTAHRNATRNSPGQNTFRRR